MGAVEAATRAIEKKETSYNNIQYIKSEVIDILLQDKKSSVKKDEVSELLAQHFVENNSVYTIRDDDKREIWIYKSGIYKPNGESYIKEFVRQATGQGYRQSILNIVLDKIEADTFIEQDKFFTNDHPYMLAVDNGILNLKTLELKPYSPEKHLFIKIPVKYKETAKINKIRGFFSEVVKEGDLKILLHPRSNKQSILLNIFSSGCATNFFIFYIYNQSHNESPSLIC